MDVENRLGVAKGEGGGKGGGEESGVDWEFGVNRCKLSPWEWISHEILPYSPGNSI